MKPTVSYGPPRQAGPHGKTLDMQAVKRPVREAVKEYIVEEVKTLAGGVVFRKVGDWSPHTNPERDEVDGKPRASLRRDVPLTQVPVESPVRKRSKATGGRTVLGPHPWRDRLHASREGGPATKADGVSS